MASETPHPDSTLNWREDYDHENGRYINTCGDCGYLFIGHKRRGTCKRCAALTAERERAEKAERERDEATAHPWRTALEGTVSIMGEKLEKAESALAACRAELEQARRVGAMMSNLCFNGKQCDRVPDDYRKSMADLQAQWDAALLDRKGEPK